MQNTEGEYSGLEHEVVPGVVESLKVRALRCRDCVRSMSSNSKLNYRPGSLWLCQKTAKRSVSVWRCACAAEACVPNGCFAHFQRIA